MKKTSKYIIIALAVLVVLGGVLAALMLTDPANTAEVEESSSQVADEELSLTSRDESELKSVKVKNQFGEFTILSTTVEKESTDADGNTVKDTAISYTVEGLEKYNLKTSTLSAAVTLFLSQTYTKEIGEITNLDEYGLGNDAVTATASFTDGTEETMKIGVTAGETSGRYVLYNGKVYIVGVNALFTSDIVSLITPASWSITEQSDDSGNTWSFLYNINVTGENFPREIEINYDEANAEYIMSKPMNATGSVSFADTLMASLQNFTANSVVAVNVTESQLEEYGLATPYAAVEFTINDESHKIVVGAKNGSERYVYVDDQKDIVYLADNETLSTWADASEEKYRDGYVRLIAIANVNKLTIDVPEGAKDIDFTRAVNEEKSTDTQTIYDYTAVYEGKEVVYKNVTSLYTNIIGMSVLNMTELPYEAEPEISFTFNYYDGSKADVIAYHKVADTDDRYVALINGEYVATVRKSTVDKFYSAYEEFKVAE